MSKIEAVMMRLLMGVEITNGVLRMGRSGSDRVTATGLV